MKTISVRFARPGEVQLKVWVMDEAARDGVTTTAIHMRRRRGLYPRLKIRKATRWLQFVTNPRPQTPDPKPE